MCRIFYHATVSAAGGEGTPEIPMLLIKLVATLAISSIAVLNAVSLELGTRAQIALTLSKVSSSKVCDSAIADGTTTAARLAGCSYRGHCPTWARKS